MHKRRILALAFALAAVSAVAGTVRAQAAQAHTAFTLSNASAGNRVIVFDRGPGGRLHRVGSVGTGGHGTGVNLGSEGALALSPDGGHLYAVNAGSDTLSVLGVSGDHVWREQVIGSGGSQPISVTAGWNRVYVLNAGDGSVTGFGVTSHGLARIANGHRALAASGSGPAQIALTPSGSALVVTNKTTNTIDTLRVRADGSLAHAVAHASTGATPFGFAFTSRGVLVVSDAGEAPSSAATAYRVGPFGGLQLRSGPVQTNQLAACWVATAPNGRFAFVSDAHSGTISAMRVSAHGQLSLVDPSGISGSGGSGSTTLDSSVTGDGRYLSVLVFNTKPGVNSIVTFRIGSGGTLTWLNAAGSVPGSTTGLVTG
jgi:YVTN family beta-propeller protein